MTMKKIFSLFAALLLCGLGAAAQLPEHVQWEARIDSTAPGRGSVVLTATMADGWHIYGFEKPTEDASMFPTELSLEPAEGVVAEGSWTPSRPAAEHFDDMLQLRLSWWDGTVEFRHDFRLADASRGATLRVRAAYMVCNAQSCTAPARRSFELHFGAAPAAGSPAGEASAAATASAATASAASGEESLWWQPVDTESATDSLPASPVALLVFGFLGGLLALLTPCVWPMIPMTVSFFLKRGRSRRRSVADALTYAGAIIAIYLLLGIAITLAFGAGKLNEIATGAVFNVLFFVLLVVFAISFFGAFDIKLPSRWSNAVDGKAESSSGMLSIFLMALTLVLVSFSCTGPIIGTLLVEAASQGNVMGPALGMGGFALGLALPFGLFAFFPSMLKEMPRSGGWLNSVKVVLGFVELILSLKFLSVADLAYGWHILDREVFLVALDSALRAAGPVPAGQAAFQPRLARRPHQRGRLLPGRVLVQLRRLSATRPLGRAAQGHQRLRSAAHTQDFNLYGGEFREFDDYDQGMAYAAEHNLPVLIDFSGYGCVNCRKMEGAVFDTPAVRELLENNFVLIKLMVDDKTRLAAPYTVEENGRPSTSRPWATAGAICSATSSPAPHSPTTSCSTTRDAPWAPRAATTRTPRPS